MNDISKIHPDLAAKIASCWYGEKVNWVVKHGCRTLLKKGYRDVFSIFGYEDASTITIEDYNLQKFLITIV